MRFLLFFAIVLGVLGAGYAYLGWRLTATLDVGHRFRRSIWIGLALMLLSPLASFLLLVAGHEGRGSDVAAWVGFVCLGFLSLLFTLLVARDVVWLGTWVSARAMRRWRGSESPTSPERRRFVLTSLNAGKVGASTLLLGYGVAEARDVPAVREVDVPIEGLVEALVGFRIVQLTDLHVGPTIKGDYVRAVVERVNALDPDLVALTGDMVDGSVAYLSDDVLPLGELRSRHGSYFCTGNHEYYSGVHTWLAHFEKLGIVPLVNAHRVIEHDGSRLMVAGVTDVREGGREPGHESDPARAVAGAPPSDFALLLAHQPKSAIDAERVGIDLVVSGHTHGGQFFPWNFFAHLAQPYVAGLHRHGRTAVYVSCGTGYWGPPLRIGAPSEITLLRLIRA